MSFDEYWFNQCFGQFSDKEQKHLRNTTRAINKICKLRSD